MGVSAGDARKGANERGDDVSECESRTSAKRALWVNDSKPRVYLEGGPFGLGGDARQLFESIEVLVSPDRHGHQHDVCVLQVLWKWRLAGGGGGEGRGCGGGGGRKKRPRHNHNHTRQHTNCTICKC